MSTRTIKTTGEMYRSASIQVSGDGDKREFSMSISSEDPCLRCDDDGFEYYEVLDHGPDGMDDTRMRAGLPILFNHDRNQHLGRATNCANENGRCVVGGIIWSESAFAQEKRRDAMNGSLPDTSVGYSLISGKQVGKREGIPVIKFKWAPHEGSLVTIPADITVGVGREEGLEKKLIAIELQKGIDGEGKTVQTRPTQKTMAEDITTQIDVSKERNEAIAAERKRVADIQALNTHFREKGLGGRKIDTAELAAQHIAQGKTEQDFRNAVMEGNFSEVKAVDTTVPELGMSKKEKENFSFLRAIYNLGTGRGLQGPEKEASDAHAKLVGKECGPNSFYVPQDIMRGSAFPRGITAEQLRAMAANGSDMSRALFSNVYSGAGAFVGTELMPSLIELLRNQMYVIQMGARSLSGLRGNVAIPRQTGGATASWLAEDSTITATQQTVGQLNLTPHKLAAATAFTEQLAMQTSIDAENFVRQDLMAITAIARDLAAIAGTGVSGQPLGIINTGSLSTNVTLSAAQSMTYANAVQFETNVAVNNAATGRLGYMATPTVRGNAKLIAEIAAANSVPVWKNGMVNGYPAVATNQVPTAQAVIFGNWDDLILADWADSNFFVDPYSLSLQGQIRVINRLYCDNGIRHTQSFAIGTL